MIQIKPFGVLISICLFVRFLFVCLLRRNFLWTFFVDFCKELQNMSPIKVIQRYWTFKWLLLNALVIVL